MIVTMETQISINKKKKKLAALGVNIDVRLKVVL